MKILYMLSDRGEVKSLSLHKSGDFATMQIEMDGRLYDITVREEKTEEEKND
jgi:hypothetical protein